MNDPRSPTPSGYAEKPSALSQIDARKDEIRRYEADRDAKKKARDERNQSLWAAERKLCELYVLEREAGIAPFAEKRRGLHVTFAQERPGTILSWSFHRSRYRHGAAINRLLIEQLRFEANLASQYRNALLELAVQHGFSHYPKGMDWKILNDALAKAKVKPIGGFENVTEDIAIGVSIIGGFSCGAMTIIACFITADDSLVPSVAGFWLSLVTLVILELIAATTLPLLVVSRATHKMLPDCTWAEYYPFGVGLGDLYAISCVWTCLAVPSWYCFVRNSPEGAYIPLVLLGLAMALDPLIVFSAGRHLPTALGFAALARQERKERLS